MGLERHRLLETNLYDWESQGIDTHLRGYWRGLGLMFREMRDCSRKQNRELRAENARRWEKILEAHHIEVLTVGASRRGPRPIPLHRLHRVSGTYTAYVCHCEVPESEVEYVDEWDVDRLAIELKRVARAHPELGGERRRASNPWWLRQLKKGGNR